MRSCDGLLLLTLIRPALLRKEFIVDSYQIYEARAYGADTILLIVATLTEEQLGEFMKISRSLGMEPLVTNTSCIVLIYV